jgi:hypothetical protein
MTAVAGYARLPVVFQQCREHARACGAPEAQVARATYRHFAALALDGRLPSILRIRDRWYALETAVPEIAVAAGLLSKNASAETSSQSMGVTGEMRLDVHA